MRERTVFVCEVCGFESTDRELVGACELTPVQPIAIAIGEIVAGVGYQIGSWAFRPFKGYDQNWLVMAEDQQNPNAAGWVKWVVLDRVLRHKVDPKAVMQAHQQVLMLYCPSHPAYGDHGGPAYVWCPDTPPLRLGCVGDVELRRFTNNARWMRPHLI